MMDVQSVYRWQDTVFVNGYYDEEEEVLNHKLTAVLDGQSNKKEGRDLIIKLWQLFMLPCANQQGVQLPYFADNRSPLYISFTTNLSFVYLPVATPPPLCG